MRSNVAASLPPIATHEGGRAVHINAEQQLRRSVLACLLFEREFYEDGQAIADRIRAAAAAVPEPMLAALAIEARSKFHLRHIPLFLTAILAGRARGSSLVQDTLFEVIQRADELAEFVAVYAGVNGVAPNAVKPKLSNQVRKGLARAFGKFNAYGLAKYNRDGAVKLRDVLFLCHANPRDAEQEALWTSLIDGTLPPPDTWEVQLSAGEDKRATWERLIGEGKLGYLALLRNLRNMEAVGVDPGLVSAAIRARKGGAERVLPFRYVAAARACPAYEPALDAALLVSLAEAPRLSGRTVVLVDVSGSMASRLSMRSDLTRMDAAATLASMVNADHLRVFSFADRLVEVPPHRGMAGVNAVIRSQTHGGTRLFEALAVVQHNIPHDRLIVITDEQAHAYGAGMPAPVCEHAYVINVASAQNGVGYGKWAHLDGFSERVLTWMLENEAA